MLRRTGALLCSAAVLASLSVATFANPASAAKPRCQGATATIVGTARGDRIVGTAGRDVIVAKGGPDRIYGKGGNDLICAGTGNDLVVGGPGADTVWGQLGNDRLLGGPGPDFLAGQVGNDTIDGGLQIDKCYQGTGTGPVVNCELPAPPVVAPPPPPEPPTLAIAYSDVNRNHAYDAGDVMIAKVIDTNGTGKVDPGDTVKMGQYPTTPYAVAPAAVRQTFEDWRVKEHPVTSADLNAFPDVVSVQAGAPTVVFSWVRIGATGSGDVFEQNGPGGDSYLVDDQNPGNDNDVVYYMLASPSLPMSEFRLEGDSKGDDGFIDVDFAPGV